jgi:hypothetical protein
VVRISATDWTEGGWSVDESVRLSRLRREHGVADGEGVDWPSQYLRGRLT